MEGVMKRTEDVAPLLQPLASLRHLQSLHLPWVAADVSEELSCVWGLEADAVWGAVLAAPLQSFTNWTSLHLG